MAVVLVPSTTVEVTRLTLATVATESSTLRVTSVSSCEGEAPGWMIVTTVIGKAMSGKRATGSLWKPHKPATHSTKNSITAGTGLRMPQLDRLPPPLMASCPRRAPRCWPAPRARGRHH